MARIVKRPAAESDLQEIFVYLGRSSTRTANRFLGAADQAMHQLAAMPALGGLCESDHPNLAGLRLWPIRRFPKYLILYRPLDDGVEVLRVVHGARQIEELFRG